MKACLLVYPWKACKVKIYEAAVNVLHSHLHYPSINSGHNILRCSTTTDVKWVQSYYECGFFGLSIIGVPTVITNHLVLYRGPNFAPNERTGLINGPSSSELPKDSSVGTFGA
jgi:hypothetical protein